MTILGSLGWLFYPAINKSSKKLLFENKLWKVYYVVENNYPAGKDNFYEVYFQDEKLTLPETIGGTRTINRFIAANGFKIGEENSTSVLIVYKYSYIKNGYETYFYKTLLVNPKYTGSKELVFETL